MKKSKLFATILAIVIALSAIFGLVACGGTTNGGNGGGTNNGGGNENDNTNGTTYVFEAEYVNVTGIQGKGYSNNAAGTDLIIPDVPDNDDWEIIIGTPGVAKASNGFYLSYLYSKGIELTFKITSDTEVNDAKLSMRLSGEYLEVVELTDDEWVVKVNGEQMKYGGFKITGINTDKAVEEKREFQDFVVTTSLHLVKGENTITFTVNNDNNAIGGTASSLAPLFDCIKIVTTAKLTWNPVLENLAAYELEEEE